MSVPLGKTLRTPPRSHEPSDSNFDSAEEHAVVGQIQAQVPESQLRQESKTAVVSKLEEESARISFEMAKQAECGATVSRNVKGHQILERQRPTTPRKIVHLMTETLGEIRQELKPAWKSNLVNMNMEDY
uniref:Uncharacterized protein n=1 Tax=Romanomermis culicivorax TaxID=13658 RepID=A0A915IFQ9_ROMCU